MPVNTGMILTSRISDHYTFAILLSKQLALVGVPEQCIGEYAGVVAAATAAFAHVLHLKQALMSGGWKAGRAGWGFSAEGP